MPSREHDSKNFSATKLMWYEASRAWQGWIVTFVLLGIVYFYAPQQLPIFFYKLVFITLGGTMGFWFYTWSFGQVNEMPEAIRTHASYQRIAVICCAMLAVSLGA